MCDLWNGTQCPLQPLFMEWKEKQKNKTKQNKTKTKTTPSEQFQNPIKDLRNRGKLDTTNTHIHDWSLSWLGTGTSVKSGGVKLLLWAHTSLLLKWCGQINVLNIRVKCQRGEQRCNKYCSNLELYIYIFNHRDTEDDVCLTLFSNIIEVLVHKAILILCLLFSLWSAVLYILRLK